MVTTTMLPAWLKRQNKRQQYRKSRWLDGGVPVRNRDVYRGILLTLCQISPLLIYSSVYSMRCVGVGETFTEVQ